MKKNKIMVLLFVVIICSLFSCAVGDLLPQSNETTVIELNKVPLLESSVAVMVKDTAPNRIYSTIERNKYLEDQKKYFDEAIKKTGIINYQFVEIENSGMEYLMVINIEGCSVRGTRTGSGCFERKASLFVTLIDNKSNKRIAKVAGQARQISKYQSIHKLMGNLLEKILSDIYKSY